MNIFKKQQMWPVTSLRTFFFNFYFYFILLYNTVLVLPYIDINQPRIELGSCQHIRAQKFELDATYREVQKNGEGRR